MDQLLITRPYYSKYALLKIFASEKLIKGIKTSKYCLKILGKIIQKDSKMLESIMELNIIDILKEKLMADDDD